MVDMQQDTPSVLAKKIERKIAAVIASVYPQDLAVKPRELVKSLKHIASDARLDVRDYEFADTRHEQFGYAGIARNRLGDLRAAMLVASEFGMFSAVDVVQLSAWIDSLLDQLA